MINPTSLKFSLWSSQVCQAWGVWGSFLYETVFLRVACRLPDDFPAAFLREGAQLRLGVDSHRVVGVLEQRHVHQRIAVGDVHAFHVQAAQHLLDLAVTCDQARGEANPAVDILHRRADGLRAKPLRESLHAWLKDAAGNMDLCA